MLLIYILRDKNLTDIPRLPVTWEIIKHKISFVNCFATISFIMYIHVYFPLSHTVYYFPKKYFKKYLHFQNPSSIISACDGLSPNGKALDSDSSIFQVRILVAQLKELSFFSSLFWFIDNFQQKTKGMSESNDTPFLYVICGKFCNKNGFSKF